MKAGYKFYTSAFSARLLCAVCVFFIFSGVVFPRSVSAGEGVDVYFKKLFSKSISSEEIKKMFELVSFTNDRLVLFESLANAYIAEMEEEYLKFKNASEKLQEKDAGSLKEEIVDSDVVDGSEVLNTLLKFIDFCSLDQNFFRMKNLYIDLITAMLVDSAIHGYEEDDFSCSNDEDSYHPYYCVLASYIEQCSAKLLKTRNFNFSNIGTFMLLYFSPGISYKTAKNLTAPFLKEFDSQKIEKVILSGKSSVEKFIFELPIPGLAWLLRKWPDMPYKVERYLFDRFVLIMDMERDVSCIYGHHLLEPIAAYLLTIAEEFSVSYEERYVLGLLSDIAACEKVEMWELGRTPLNLSKIEDKFLMRFRDMPFVTGFKYFSKREIGINALVYALFIKNNFVFRKDLPKLPDRNTRLLFDPDVVYDETGKKLSDAGFHRDENGKFIVPGYADFRELTGSLWKYSWDLRRVVYSDKYHNIKTESLYNIEKDKINYYLTKDNEQIREDKIKSFLRFKSDFLLYREPLIVFFLNNKNGYVHFVVAVKYIPKLDEILCIDPRYKTYYILGLRKGVPYYRYLDSGKSAPIFLMNVVRVKPDFYRR